MELKSSQNKWLTVKPGVIITALADEVISKLDPVFAKYKMERVITSGRRDQSKQLQLIINEAVRRKLPVPFTKDDYGKKLPGGIYVWQTVWSEVLTFGYMVSPPFNANCLEDYQRPSTGGGHTLIKEGTLRWASGHFYNDFDISGWRGNQSEAQKKSIDDEMRPMKEALRMNIGIVNVLPEKANGAVHVSLARA